MIALASLAPSLSRSTLPTGMTPSRTQVDAQSALANRLAERLGLKSGALGSKADDFTPDKVADRVLGFIGQRLQNEAAAGADSDKLESLMAQAREGVEKGFAEAREILDGMGVLKGKVAEDIDSTYNKIQKGLQDLEQPHASKPQDSRSSQIAAAAYSERLYARSETFDLQITTRDGDRLHILVAAASANWSQTAAVASSDGSNSLAALSSRSGSLQVGGFQVQVEGELDNEERAALEDLFGQVTDLSKQFYAGDLAGAFDRAMQLDMDGSQLASMSLRLTQTTVRQATDAYSTVAQQGGQAASAVNDSLVDYARGLLNALRTADKVSADGKDTLSQLLDGSFALDKRFGQDQLDKAKTLNQLLLDGLQGVSPAAD